MDGPEFSKLRGMSRKSQKELSTMLGVSQKAVESYEQGWRPIPATVERLLYYIVFKLNRAQLADQEPCWVVRTCPEQVKLGCSAWASGDGHFCWFITGRLCAAAKAAGGSDAYCYECPVFASMLHAIGQDRIV